MLNWNGWLFSPDKTYVRLWSLAVCFTIRHSTQIGGTKACCSYGWFGFNMNEAWPLANGSTEKSKKWNWTVTTKGDKLYHMCSTQMFCQLNFMSELLSMWSCCSLSIVLCISVTWSQLQMEQKSFIYSLAPKNSIHSLGFYFHWLKIGIVWVFNSLWCTMWKTISSIQKHSV